MSTVRPRPVSVCALTLLLAFWGTSVPAADLGRLFHTPAERHALDQPHETVVDHGEPDAAPVSRRIDGLLRSSAGRPRSGSMPNRSHRLRSFSSRPIRRSSSSSARIAAATARRRQLAAVRPVRRQQPAAAPHPAPPRRPPMNARRPCHRVAGNGLLAVLLLSAPCRPPACSHRANCASLPNRARRHAASKHSLKHARP